MKLKSLFEGVLDYKGDTAHPATPPGAPTQRIPGSDIPGEGHDMSPKKKTSLLEKIKKLLKKRADKNRSI